MGMLCLVYSRIAEWQKVFECANLALNGMSLHVGGHHVLLDITLRRAVALTHMAGPTAAEPLRLPNVELLCQAERDFLEVHKTRPKDEAVRRGLQHIGFLKTQSQAAMPTVAPQHEHVTGLARLRAMDA